MARQTPDSFATAANRINPQARHEQTPEPRIAHSTATASEPLATFGIDPPSTDPIDGAVNGLPAMEPGLLGQVAAARAVAVAGLLTGVALGALLAMALAGPAPERLQQDAELAGLVRSMVGIKAVILVGALALLVWRLGRPVKRQRLVAYTTALGLSGAAVAWMWSLNSIPLAALCFYGGLIGCYLVASGDSKLLNSFRMSNPRA